MIHVTDAFAEDFFFKLGQHVLAGNVSAREHPDLPLTIYNYTPQCAYARSWDDVTLACRGLILDVVGNVVARPFPKFFNLGEHEALATPDVAMVNTPRLPTTAPHLVYDKLDGSLGIAYEYEGHIGVATRGSFTSEQALWATEWLLQTHPEWTPKRDSLTHLFEIIYPENRIVVNYGERAEMVELAIIENYTGADLPLTLSSNWPGARAERFDVDSLEVLARACNDRDNSEGFVCMWLEPDAPSLRIKIKADEYVAMHRIVTGLSNRTIWEALSTGRIDALRESVPDELYEWFDEQIDILDQQFIDILAVTRSEMDRITWALGAKATRKQLAEVIQEHATYPGLCFGLLDEKDVGDRIWKMIKPARETPVLTIQEDAE